MWLVARYQPTSLFSLRPCTATSSGGKSLLVPTPYALKMALLDVAIRCQGLERGRQLFPGLRDLQVALDPPPRIVVNNTFAKIQRLKEFKGAAGDKEAAVARAKADRQWPFQSTIAFREVVQWAGPLALALQGMAAEELAPLLIQLNYLGRRGGFVQLLRPPERMATLPERFTLLTPPAGVGGAFPLGTMQLLDDWGSSMSFEAADIYSGQRIRPGQERVVRHVVLPYRPARFSKGFTLYERLND